LANFIRGLFGDHGPDGGGLIWLTRMPIRVPFLMGGEFTCSPLSTVIIGLCTLVLVTGAKESSRFNNAMTVLNLSILGFVIISGIGTNTIDSENLTPFIPHGIQGVSRGAGFVFFAFIGFDMVACLSEEVVNPEKNMPRGIVGSLIISTAIYVSVSLVVIGMAPVALLGGDVPITNALLANACCTHEQQLAHDAAGQCLIESCAPLIHRVLLHGSHLISFGAIFGLTTGTFTSLMG
jgi:amino acid transporter